MRIRISYLKNEQSIQVEPPLEAVNFWAKFVKLDATEVN
jgi:hypothetical protein